MSNAGEAVTLIRDFEVVGDFSFQAASFTFTPTNPLPGVAKTYGSVNSSAVPSFVSAGSGNSGTPDAILMSVEPANAVPALGFAGRFVLGVVLLAVPAVTRMRRRG